MLNRILLLATDEPITLYGDGIQTGEFMMIEIA